MRFINSKIEDESHTFIKNTGIVMAGSVIGNILSYGYHVVVGRILGPQGYGELGALLSMFYILNVPSGVIQTGLTKYFAVLKARKQLPQSRALYIFSMKTLSIIGGIGCIFLLPFLSILSSFLHMQSALGLIYLYFIFWVYLITIPSMAYYAGYQFFLTSTIVTNINAFARVVCGAIGALFGVSATLLANVVSNIVGFFVSFKPMSPLLQEKSVSLSISKKRIVAYGLPMMVALLAGTSLYSMDVVLVKHFFSSQTAGIYTSLSVLGKIIFFASFAITSVLFPTISEHKEKGSNYQKILWLGVGSVTGISAIVTLFYFLFPAFVVHLLFGPAYNQAIGYIGQFGIFLSFVSIATLFIQVYLAQGRVIVSYFAGFAALLQIVLIILYHADITQVITINIAVTGILCLVLAIGSLPSKKV